MQLNLSDNCVFFRLNRTNKIQLTRVELNDFCWAYLKMGRTFLADEKIQAYVENLQRTGTWYLGLVIGKVSI